MTATCAQGVWDGLKCANGASTPDLTATAPSPTNVTINTPTIFTGTIINNGLATTGGVEFYNIFQTSPVSDGSSGVLDYEVVMSDTLAEGGGNAVSQTSITLTSGPRMYVRVCADKANAGDDGIINEGANEDNNCSWPWTEVTVNTPSSPTASISANPSTVEQGQSTILTWSSTSTNYCTSNFFAGQGATSGSQTVTPVSLPYTYSISCVNTNLGEASGSEITIIKRSKIKPCYNEDVPCGPQE